MYIIFSGTTLIGVLNLLFFLKRVINLIGHIPNPISDTSPTSIGLTGHYIVTILLIVLMYIGGLLWFIMTVLYFFLHKNTSFKDIRGRDLVLSATIVLGAFYLFFEIIKKYGEAIDWLFD